jgi:hypothetical protein
MKARKRPTRRKQSTVVPPIPLEFEDAVARLLKAKPQKKASAKKK